MLPRSDMRHEGSVSLGQLNVKLEVNRYSRGEGPNPSRQVGIVISCIIKLGYFCWLEGGRGAGAWVRISILYIVSTMYICHGLYHTGLVCRSSSAQLCEQESSRTRSGTYLYIYLYFTLRYSDIHVYRLVYIR